jgi:lipid II:glycine glycyltransferase (peptidoglycan interpeptide bridge formation enzyme)
LDFNYLTYNQIDKAKWDECISSCKNHLVYAESWYLDIVCSKNWSALVLNDYEAVMPLPLKTKMGLTYVQQPFWTQQLGVFSKQEITNDLVDSFLVNIPKKLALISTNLNSTNFTEKQNLDAKTNLVLDLNTSFETLKTAFSSNTKRNCNKAAKEGLTIDYTSNNVEEYINFFKAHIKNPVSEFHYTSLEQLITESLKHSNGFIALVKHENEIVAASYLLISDNRIIYRTGTSNQKGKDTKAMFFLVESLIKEYKNKAYTLDFEGSDLEGVARFYKGFGATTVPYYYYKKYNNTLLKILKK